MKLFHAFVITGLLAGSVNLMPLALAQDAFEGPSGTQDIAPTGAAGLNSAGPSGGGQWAGKGHGCHIFEKLNLTSDQKAKFKSAKASFKAQNEPLMQDIKSKHQALKQLGKNGDKSQREILRTALKADHEKLKSQWDNQLQSILTPAQFSQFQSLKEQCRGSMRNGGQRGGRGQWGKGNRRG